MHTFLLELLHDAGQTDLGSELEEVLIQDLVPRLEDRLILTAVQHLSSQQEQEVKNMSESGKNSAEIIVYLKNQIPNFEELISQAMIDFREVYINASETR